MDESLRDEHPQLALDGVTVDWRQRTLSTQDGDVTLPDYLVRLLAYFVDHEGQVVTRESLALDVWNFAPGVQSNAVGMGVSRLRRLIERDVSKPRHILTVRGEGWIFVGLQPAEGESVRTNISRPATPMVGRFVEVQEVRSALGSAARHVHVVGPPGVGKSRVIVQAVLEHLSDVADAEVWWVGDREQSLRAGLATVLEVAERDVVETLRHRPDVTVVVDPVQGRTDAVLDLLAETGARVVTVGPTPHPLGRSIVVGPLNESDSVTLLMAGAAAIGCRDTLTSSQEQRLVEQLGGLPARIVVASVRLRVLGVEALLAEPIAEPQDAMRSVIATLPDRTINAYHRWRWLSDSFSVRDAAELAALSDLQAEACLGQLMGLGLVRRVDGILPLAMVRKHRVAHGDEGLSDYVAWACTFVARLHRATAGGTWASIVDMEARRGEFAAAAAVAGPADQVRILWRLSALLGFRGRQREAFERTVGLDLSLLSDGERREATALLALRCALLRDAERTRDYLGHVAKPWPVAALRAAIRVKVWGKGAPSEVDPSGVLNHPHATPVDKVMALLSAAGQTRRSGQLAASEAWALKAAAVVERHNVERLRPGVWAHLGSLHRRSGDPLAALAALEKALSACMDDDYVPAPVVLLTLGNLQSDLQLPDAPLHLRRAARAFRRAGDWLQCAQCYSILAMASIEQGKASDVQAAMTSAMAMVLGAGQSHMDVSVATMLCLASAARGHWAIAAYHLEQVALPDSLTTLQRRHVMDLRALIGVDNHLDVPAQTFYAEIDNIHQLARASLGLDDDVLERIRHDPGATSSLGVRLAIRAVDARRRATVAGPPVGNAQ